MCVESRSFYFVFINPNLAVEGYHKGFYDNEIVAHDFTDETISEMVELGKDCAKGMNDTWGGSTFLQVSWWDNDTEHGALGDHTVFAQYA